MLLSTNTLFCVPVSFIYSELKMEGNVNELYECVEPCLHSLFTMVWCSNTVTVCSSKLTRDFLSFTNCDFREDFVLVKT